MDYTADFIVIGQATYSTASTVFLHRSCASGLLSTMRINVSAMGCRTGAMRLPLAPKPKPRLYIFDRKAREACYIAVNL